METMYKKLVLDQNSSLYTAFGEYFLQKQISYEVMRSLLLNVKNFSNAAATLEIKCDDHPKSQTQDAHYVDERVELGATKNQLLLDVNSLQEKVKEVI